MKIYEANVENGYDFTTYYITDNVRKDIRQEYGIAYLDMWDGRNWVRLNFSSDKKTIRENYLLIKDKFTLYDYFGVGYDLDVFIERDDTVILCESSRMQGTSNFGLSEYINDAELYTKCLNDLTERKLI